MKVGDIVEAASKLSEEERASIASRLRHGLESPHHWVSAEEVPRRMKEAKDDPSVGRNWDQIKSELGR